MVSLERKCCPDSVRDVINDYISSVEESGFFISPEIPQGYEENGKIYLWNLLVDNLIKKFIDGDDLILTLNEFEVVLTRTCVYTMMDRMVDKGFLDTFENENGEEMFFITEEGKKVISQINDQNYMELF